MGSFSIWHWLVVLLIIVLIFGTKKLKNIGQDVGEAVKNFKKAVNEEDKTTNQATNTSVVNPKPTDDPNKPAARRSELMSQETDVSQKTD